MSSGPHPPLPGGPDPDERTEVRPVAPADPFAVPVDAPLPGEAPPSAADPAAAGAAAPPPDPFAPTPPSSGTSEPGLADKARAFAEQAREKAQPLADQARPYAEQAREKAQPLIDQARPYAEQAREKAQPLVDKAQPLTVKAQAFADRPEGKVVVAFAGGVLASFVLKGLGR
jgi:hypothetical protein